MGEPIIPLVDLKAQYRDVKPEVDAAVAAVLEGGNFILGAEGGAFEKEFAAYCEARFAVGVDSGTRGLHPALFACGVGPRAGVITTAFTFVGTLAALPD